MTIRDLLSNDTYTQKPVLEKLICYYCDVSKSDLFAHSERVLTDAEVQQVTDGYTRYTTHHQPLEYVLGCVEFAGLRFHVTPATLIPRPETEYMIEAIRERAATQSLATTTLRDIGTWCGVLGLSTLYYEHRILREAYLTDLSEEALAVARWNFDAVLPVSDFRFHISFIQSDLLTAPLLTESFKNTANLLLVANLPYIPDQLFATNVEDNVKKREPKMAFVGGEDWLDLYRIMLRQAIDLQKTYGKKPVTCFLEMMTRQGELLQKEFAERFTFEEVKTFHFNIRIVKGVMR